MSTIWDYKLLKAIEERPVIYNNTLPHFRDNSQKNKEWKTISKLVIGRDDSDTVSTVKSRWKSIRDTYVKYKNNKSRTGERFKKIKPYKYEEELRFLNPYIVKLSHVTLFSGLCNDGSAPTIKEEPMFSISYASASSSTEITDQDNSTSEYNDDIKIDTHSICDFDLSTASTAVPLENESIGGLNEIETFFLGLAKSVSKLSPLTIAKIKKGVANVVLDAEINELEQGERNQKS